MEMSWTVDRVTSTREGTQAPALVDSFSYLLQCAERPRPPAFAFCPFAFSRASQRQKFSFDSRLLPIVFSTCTGLLAGT
jgi:hypothetical protein